MKFSIIIVCYNAGEKLKKTVDSVLQQTYSNYEVIVKDGMSTDNSLKTLPLNQKIIVTSCKDTGIYDAMNQAVKQATGEYLYFLNCGDTFYKKDVLKELEAYITKQPGKGIYYGDTFNESSLSIVPLPKEITAFTCYRHIPCHQACIYEKELCTEKIYDTSYCIRADYDHFLWCFFDKNVKPAHIGILIANYEGGGFSENKENIKRDKMEHREITRKYLSLTQLFLYKSFMLITLMPLRRFLANNKYFSKLYQGLKNIFY